MKRFTYLIILSSILFFGCFKPASKTTIGETVMLPNGWKLSPVGRSLPLGDLPLNMAVSSSNKYIAVSNNGYGKQTLQLIDPKNETLLDEKEVAKIWYGLAFSADDKTLYVSGGFDNRILSYQINGGKLALKDSFIIDKKMNAVCPAGIQVDDKNNKLYTVSKEVGALYIIDLSTKSVKKITLPAESYSCLFSPDKSKLYISCWGCDKVMVFDPKTETIIKQIAVGDNPNEMVLTKNGKRLFVANANDNTVSVIATDAGKVIETLDAALFPNAPSGSTTNGLALTPDDEKLFIANADNNCLAVFDVEDWGKSKSEGFIPVGWYPTNVKVVGKKVFVTNGKGFASKANPYGPNPLAGKGVVLRHQGDSTKPVNQQYIGGLFIGTMSIFSIPTDVEMAAFSKMVYANTPYTKAKEMHTDGEPGNPIPQKVGEPSPIKYVFYVIKENRTYDQVLGDMPQGNGDTSLVLFGKHITPNQHKLANEFVLLDNFYVNAEVSADGHNWSTGAYATDYLEKSWPTYYGGRGGSYYGEGEKVIANNKAGFIWDHCKKYGISFRTYGEFADDAKPNIPVLKDHVCTSFQDYNLSVRDTVRFGQWQKDFGSLLAINSVPRFNTVRFGNDHTEGMKKGRPSPYAHVADNDLAVGMFVEYLSKSPIWKETAVFILEDDAQNGADHVDAHRSAAYVAGPFVKRGFVDHTMYSTSSMLRTMELILGMPPMTQYDAAAMPMWRCFTAQPNFQPFVSVPSNISLDERNTVFNIWQQKSEQYNFAKEDAAPDVEFAEVLWHTVKGEHVKFPGPKRAAFLKISANDNDD